MQGEKFVALDITLAIREGLKAAYELGSDSNCLATPLSFRCSVNRSRNDAREVSRNSIRRLSVAQLGYIGNQRSVGTPREQLLKLARQQRLMQSRLEEFVRQVG